MFLFTLTLLAFDSNEVQTSALDTYTEQALLQNINSILKEKHRTSVFVAHRLRTICDCDQILVLQDGNVAETGSHRELIERNGMYAELWNGKIIISFGPWWRYHWLTWIRTAQETLLGQSEELDEEAQEKKDRGPLV